MKKVWSVIKDISLPLFSLAYFTMWILNKFANKIRFKNEEKSNRLETAGGVAYVIALINSVIYLVS